jgi:hypothetical protein
MEQEAGWAQEASVEERNPLPVQKIERRFLGRQPRSLVTVPTTPFCLHNYLLTYSMEQSPS